MSENHPTALAKPSKPYPDFPLFPHATRRWAKKIRGKLHYFGPWDNPTAALDAYLAQKDDLHAGRKPRPDPDALTVKTLGNAFLNHKQALVDASELSPRTWLNAKEATDLLVAHFGKQRAVADLGPDDFADLRSRMVKKWGPVRVRDLVQRVRGVFKYAYDVGLIDRPMRFGPGFARPTKKVIRLHRAAKGPKLFTPQQIRAMIRKAGQPLRAMLLLGINCGFGNADCGTLPLKALDLATGWVNFPRPKTGTPRRCPLWPETVAALREAIHQRSEPRDPTSAGLAFITSHGLSWHKKIDDNPISKETAKLLKALKLYRGRGLGFYVLRHCLETIGGETKDQVAVDHIMGHARDDMASIYRERVSDDRLKAIANHVRSWLFGDTAGQRSAWAAETKSDRLLRKPEEPAAALGGQEEI
jgi:integrase